MKKMENKKDGLGLFIMLAFCIPFLCSLLILKVSIFKGGTLNLIIYGIEGASPTIAVLILMYIKNKKQGIKNCIRKKYISNCSGALCIIAFLVPALMLTFAKLISNLIMGKSQFMTLVSRKKLVIIMWALVAEELGWRGYLQDVVEKRLGTLLMPLCVGFIWTLWHYHFFIIGSMEVPFIAFAWGGIAESYGYYVITKSAKGNIVPASIWHFSGNFFFNLYLLDPGWNNGSMIPYHIVNALYMLYIIAFIILLKSPSEKKSTLYKG